MTILAPPEPGLRPVNEPARLWRGTAADLRAVWEHRELLRAFTARELRSRYKGAAFGWAWALVRPLVMLLIYGLAVGVFLGAGRAIPQFMVFIYCGLLAWTLFSTIVLSCINSVVGAGGLVTRASFPRLLLPLSAVLAAMVDFVLQALVLGVGWAVFQDLPDAAGLLYLPLALVTLLLFGLGVGLALSAVNVYVRDIGFLADVGLQVGFWLAPIIYSYGQVVRGAQDFGLAADLVTRLYMLNPMANVIIGFQRALWPAGTSPEAVEFAFPGALAARLVVFALVSAVTAWVGMRIFVKLSGNFGQAVTVAVRFERVSKDFRINATNNVKELLLGVAGHRRRSERLQAVRDLDFDITVGESVALLGHNGSGKSTTLKMLAGTVAPSSGRIWARGRIAPLLELGAGFHPDLTGRENVFLNAAILGIRRAEAARRFESIIAFAGVEDFLDTPVKFFSSGMAVRLGFAIAVNVDPDILLVDEVLAVGDEAFQAKCLERMRQFREDGRTVVLVTHALEQAKAFCDRALVLDHGRLTYDGSAEGADDAYHHSSRDPHAVGGSAAV